MSPTVESHDKDRFGLDKDSRLEAKRAAEKENEMPDSLDPPFPYCVVAFDPVVVTRSGA